MKLDPYVTLTALAKEQEWPKWVKEYKFHPVRKWRFDLAWPELKIAIEIEGVVYHGAGGRHQRAKGYIEDIKKYRQAALMGWMLLRYAPEEIHKDLCLVEYEINVALRTRRGQKDAEA